METTSSDSLRAWYDIDVHRFVLQGMCPRRNTAVAPSVTFVACSVLASPDTFHLPDAIVFDTEIHIPEEAATQPLNFRAKIGFYGSLAKLRSDIVSLQSGESHEATLSLFPLTLNLFSFCDNVHPTGAVCVSGTLSNVVNTTGSAWAHRPDRIIGWISPSQIPAYFLRFAFLMPLVDRQVLDDFTCGIDKLLAYLRARSTS